MFVGAWIFAVTTFSQAGTGVFCQGEEVDPDFLGNQFDNILDGTPTKDVMYGGGGDDYIFGNGGNDVICGNANKRHHRWRR
jgi:Ca2+-binding RTX toxin-like protein